MCYKIRRDEIKNNNIREDIGVAPIIKKKIENIFR